MQEVRIATRERDRERALDLGRALLARRALEGGEALGVELNSGPRDLRRETSERLARDLERQHGVDAGEEVNVDDRCARLPERVVHAGDRRVGVAASDSSQTEATGRAIEKSPGHDHNFGTDPGRARAWW